MLLKNNLTLMSEAVNGAPVPARPQFTGSESSPRLMYAIEIIQDRDQPVSSNARRGEKYVLQNCNIRRQAGCASLCRVPQGPTLVREESHGQNFEPKPFCAETGLFTKRNAAPPHSDGCGSKRIARPGVDGLCIG